jgi:hypothetical protein
MQVEGEGDLAADKRLIGRVSSREDIIKRGEGKGGEGEIKGG